MGMPLDMRKKSGQSTVAEKRERGREGDSRGRGEGGGRSVEGEKGGGRVDWGGGETFQKGVMQVFHCM